jgi:ABC-2 type transport system ATP-binding protein
MLHIENLSKNYGKKQALIDFSLTLENHVYGLLGPNGSGKTTLLRIITGLLDATSGKLLFDGQTRKPMSNGRVTIGYLPQTFGLLKELNVFEQMEYFANLKRIPVAEQKEAIKQALTAVNLEEYEKSRCGYLSGGMTRRVGVAQAILGKPDLILFDEPTTGLDPEERLRFKKTLHSIAGRCPILLSTHIVEDVESVCDQVVVLHEGRILADDTLNNLVQRAAGRVYEMPLALQEQLEIPHFVTRFVNSQGNDKSARVILTDSEGDHWQQPPDWQQCVAQEPTVEDGYMYLIKRVSQS